MPWSLAVIHAAVDVLALFVDGAQDTARVAVELVFRLRIADALDGIAGNGLQIDINIAAHFAHDDDLACRHKGLTGHAGLVVIGKELVQNGV